MMRNVTRKIKFKKTFSDGDRTYTEDLRGNRHLLHKGPYYVFKIRGLSYGVGAHELTEFFVAEEQIEFID